MPDIAINPNTSMKYINIVLSLLSVLFFASCSEAKLLSKNFNKYQIPIEYLHDSNIITCDKSVKIAIEDNSNIFAFDAPLSVTKTGGKVLPFIFYNYIESIYNVTLGQYILEQNYTDFFSNSFLTESQRTGCFSVTDFHEESDYTIQITHDTCAVSSEYQQIDSILFLLFAYSASSQEIGFPTQTTLSINVKLKKEGDSVFEKNYSINKVQPFINNNYTNINNLRSAFVINMVESLSLGTKECVEQIIQDINNTIGQIITTIN